MAVKDTLPEVGQLVDPFDSAVLSITHALRYERRGDTENMIHTRYALAHIRAWRKGLPDQGVRQDDYPASRSDRSVLLAAAHGVLWAHQSTRPDFYLRVVEAALRTLIKRHQGGA